MRSRERIFDAVLWVALSVSWLTAMWLAAPRLVSGYKYVQQAHVNGNAGAQAFNYLAQPVKMPDGHEVALGDVLRQMADQYVKRQQ